MPRQSRAVVLDDGLLIEELLVGLPKGSTEIHTTSYWYYRACRAAALGAGGHLSGPFDELGEGQQREAIVSLLELREDILLPDPRTTVPAMVRFAGRYPHLNLLNLEAVALGDHLGATLWLSPESANGVLPGILDLEDIGWRTVTFE